MDFERDSTGFWIASLWILNGFALDFERTSNEFCMIPNGLPIDFTWVPHGLNGIPFKTNGESIQNRFEIVGKTHSESIGNAFKPTQNHFRIHSKPMGNPFKANGGFIQNPGEINWKPFKNPWRIHSNPIVSPGDPAWSPRARALRSPLGSGNVPVPQPPLNF